MKWIANSGMRPELEQVHIKLNCDEEDWPGVECVRYFQNPHDWDWVARGMGCVAITHYAEVTE